MSVEDLHEGAVDQLVDETLARLHELRHLLATEQLTSWTGADARTAAAQVIARLTTGPARYPTARALLSSLPYTDDPARVRTTWWATPLGGLVSTERAPRAQAPATTPPTQASYDILPQPVTPRLSKPVA